MHSHQIVSIWNRYKTGTDKPCAYMEPGRFAPDPSLTTIQFGTASNGTLCKHSHRLSELEA